MDGEEIRITEKKWQHKIDDKLRMTWQIRWDNAKEGRQLYEFVKKVDFVETRNGLNQVGT